MQIICVVTASYTLGFLMTKNPWLVFRLKDEISKQKIFEFSLMEKMLIIQFHRMEKMLRLFFLLPPPANFYMQICWPHCPIVTKFYIQTNKATTNIFCLHTEPRKTTRYTNILKLVWGGGEGKRANAYHRISYMKKMLILLFSCIHFFSMKLYERVW